MNFNRVVQRSLFERDGEYRKAYKELSGKASDVARQLSFAGIAIVYILLPVGPNSKIPDQLVFSMLLFCLAIANGLLQYIIGALIWGGFHRYHGNKATQSNDPDLMAPAYLNWPTNVNFYSKFVFVFVSYILILNYCWGKWQV